MNNIQEKYRIFIVFTDTIAEKLIKKVNFGNKVNALVLFNHVLIMKIAVTANHLVTHCLHLKIKSLY